MAGVLQFTLGLEASKFLGQIEHAGAALGRFMLAGVEGAISTGAKMADLSKRTGEASGTLFSLQKAFAAVGLEGGSVGTVLFQMQKSLGGFSEFGNPTKDIFAAMGLDIEKLKASGGAEALFAITDALSKLNQSEATKASSLIFGRAGAGAMVQFSRSMQEGRQAYAASASMAASVERTAESFDQLEKSVGRLKKDKPEALFHGIAEGVAPAIQTVVDRLNAIDLLPLGEKLGQVVGSLGSALTQGGLADAGNILYLTIALGVERIASFITSVLGNPGFWAGIWQAGVAGMGTVGTSVTDKVFKGMNTAMFAAGSALGMDETALAKAHTLMDDAIDKTSPNKDGTARAILAEGLKNIISSAKEGVGMMGGRTPLSAELAELLGRFKPVLDAVERNVPEGELGAGKGGKEDKSKAFHQASGDSLTRIGAFQGGGNASADYARATAENTKSLMQIARETLGAIRGNYRRDFTLDFDNIP